jgi:Domain of Unknown Function (DUF1206)
MSGWARLPGVNAAWRALRSSGVIELAARVGYASRGVVYLSVALMALLKAVGLSPHAEGAVGALEAWAKWPVGVVLLWITGMGLCGFAAWRALQSVVDVEHLGLGLKAISTRIGKAVSGLLYGALGVTVLHLLDTLRDLRKDDDDADTAASVQHTLTLPFGRTLVIAFGALLLAVGLGNMVRAFVDHFTRALASEPRWDGLIGVFARIGYFARGVAFLPAGIFIILAGWRSRPHEALSIGHSLDTVLTLPFGEALLSVQALGLGAFGVFGLAKAICRRVELEDDI